MSWTVDSSGTQTATGSGTEDVLVAGATTNATYQLKVDLSNMALGDVTLLKVYTKALTGGTLRLAWSGVYSNIPITQIAISPMIASDFSIKCSLTQLVGTGRGYDWSLLRA